MTEFELILIGDYAGEVIRVPEPMADSDVCHIDVGILRQLIARLQAAEGQRELLRAQIQDAGIDIVRLGLDPALR